MDVKCRRCLRLGCDKHPCFNFPGSTLGKYCFRHKKKGMVNVRCRPTSERQERRDSRPLQVPPSNSGGPAGASLEAGGAAPVSDIAAVATAPTATLSSATRPGILSEVAERAMASGGGVATKPSTLANLGNDARHSAADIPSTVPLPPRRTASSSDPHANASASEPEELSDNQRALFDDILLAVQSLNMPGEVRMSASLLWHVHGGCQW